MDIVAKITVGTALVAGMAIKSWAADDSGDAHFFDSIAMRFQEEYVACTKDSRPLDVKRIVLWKKKMDAWTGTGEYADLTRDYQKNVGKAISPCKLMEWSKRRKQEQEENEAAFVKDLLESDEAAGIAEELKACRPSRFDFAEIPFGVSKLTFTELCKKKFNYPLLEKGRFLYIEELPLNGRAFLAAFFFNDDGIFYKYEIESAPLPADSLNRAVRPAAEHLAAFFENRLGPPKQIDRVGFYDIKSKELALYKKWETPANSLNLGFSVFDYHYYAKVVSVDKKLLQASRQLIENRSAEQ
jgi:hypothetical protein